MMRWLLALLIVLNLGLFLWTRMHVVSTQSVTPQIIRPPGVQDIVLTRETDQQQTIPAVLEQEQVATDVSGNPPAPATVEDMASSAQPLDSVLEPEINHPEIPLAVAVETPEPTLLAEAAPEPTAPEPTAAEPAAPEPVCGRAGPYSDKAAAEKQQESSQQAGLLLDVHQTSVQVSKGYWVLIPPMPNRQEARQTVDRLKEAGVTDLWLFTKGPMNNAISLGLYSGIRNATSRSVNINKKGFDSEVSPRVSEQTRYWLNYKAMDEQALAVWLDNLPAGLQNEKKACE